ncbi:MAG: efflux RND transporter periplasmic adaptor subunit [Phycisphaerales bacterium]|nr:MAG: efflux RND transporter periplasmic adaptor subunit [Phycisphaerales bacterium]
MMIDQPPRAQSDPCQPVFSALRAMTLGAIIGWSVLITGIAACERGASPTSSDANEPSETRTPIAAVELSRRDLSRQLSTSAAVEPRVRIRLAARTTGTIDSVEVEEGDRVREGDLLAQLDMSEALAELDRARAMEAQAEAVYARQAELLESRLTSHSEYDQARTDLSVATSVRRLWETRIAFGRMTAPRDAVIVERFIEPGEAIENNDVAFELAAMDELVLRIGVSELDVVHLEVGQTVPVHLDAMPDTPRDGTIRRISPTAERSSRLITVEILLPPDAHERNIRPGFLGRINIPIDERPDVLAVPAAAIGEDDEGTYVYVVKDDRLKRRAIVVGATRGQWTEVSEGLEDGEIVLATNPIDMSDGEAVRIVGWRG